MIVQNKESFQEPVDMMFTIELLSVEDPKDYDKESWQMKPEEKMQLIPNLKAEGNELYKQNKIAEAEAKYKKALGMVEQLMLREKPEDKEWLEFRAQKMPLLLNFAQCKLFQKDYYAVIEHTSEVIEADHGMLGGCSQMLNF